MIVSIQKTRIHPENELLVLNLKIANQKLPLHFFGLIRQKWAQRFNLCLSFSETIKIESVTLTNISMVTLFVEDLVLHLPFNIIIEFYF